MCTETGKTEFKFDRNGTLKKDFFMTKSLIVKYLFIFAIFINFVGCCSYSFTGASVPEHLKTIAIPVVDDRSGSAEPEIRQLLTRKITTKFIDDNTLRIADKSSANSVLECAVVSFGDAPSVVAAGETVSKRRITITVQVVFRDLIKRKTIYEKNFSDYGDYDPSKTENRKKGIEDALDKISDNILLDTVSGW